MESGANRGGKLRAWLVCEFSAGELLVEHPDADQHRRPGPWLPVLPRSSALPPTVCPDLRKKASR
jgi:hypothetical protein